LPELAAAAQGGGLMTLLPELDGVVRRVPLVINVAGKLYPALSVEMLRVGQGESTYVLRTNPYGIEQLIVGAFVVPTDSRGQVWVRYAPRRTPIYLPARAALDGSVRPEVLAGRLVLVGTSAAGLQDIRATPLDAALPGVEVHAQLIETILGQTFLSRPDYLPAMEFWLLIALGLGMIVVVPIAGARWGAVAAAAIATILGGGAAYVFAVQAFMLDVTLVLLTVGALYGVLAYAGFRGEEAARRQIRSAFARYLSPAYVEQLVASPSPPQLGGETRNITLLFCDIRGFTTLSEGFRDDPQGLTRLINRFMTPMSSAIQGKGGTIDKYIGDCVMAFWNAPLPEPEHAARACAAALEMIAGLGRLNAELRAKFDGSHVEYREAKALAEAQGAARNPARAVQLFRAEAERGYANAQYNLAKACRDGEGVVQDQVDATRWFRAAAEQGHARAQERLGTRLLDGLGAPRDVIEGVAWLSLAVAQGLGSAVALQEKALAALPLPQREAAARRAQLLRPRLVR
jgi:adenylate cyclase